MIKKSVGFTLMEVLVALVILSTAFTTIFMSISSNAKSLLYLQNKTAASWVALNVIAAAQLHLINLSNNTTSHTDSQFNKTWYWRAVVSQTTNSYFSQIDVDVKQDENSEPMVHFTGYLHNRS